MTHIRSALAALLLVGGAVVASAQQTTPAVPGARGQHAVGARAGRQGPGGAGMRDQLFHGITLSAAEKANIKSVRQKYATQTKALHEQFKPQTEAMRAARQRGDTAALRTLRQNGQPQREQTKQLMLAERNDLRAALTPANQAKFDTNVSAAEQRMAKRMNKGRANGRRLHK